MNPTNSFPLFDPSRPVYVKQEVCHMDGKFRKRGELFDWQALGVEPWKIQSLFLSDILHHNPEMEEQRSNEVALKDLEEMTIEELHIYIDRLNARLKPKLKTAKDYNNKKCPKVPKDCETQIRRIRNWRLTYGDLLD